LAGCCGRRTGDGAVHTAGGSAGDRGTHGLAGSPRATVCRHARERDRSGEFTAIRLEEGGKTTKVGARIIKHTYVYVVEREIIRQLGSSPGACDPAFSPDGSRLAVVTANGLWLYTPRLEDARELAATRLPETPTNEFDYTAFSKPRWSSDGLRIAFVVGNSGTAWVQVVDVKTTRSSTGRPKRPTVRGPAIHASS
jgi:Tol biopolymer transport system component